MRSWCSRSPRRHAMTSTTCAAGPEEWSVPRSFHIALGLDDQSVADPHQVDAADLVGGAFAPVEAPAENRAVVPDLDGFDVEPGTRHRGDLPPEAEAGVTAFIPGAVRCRHGVLEGAIRGDQILEQRRFVVQESGVEALHD